MTATVVKLRPDEPDLPPAYAEPVGSAVKAMVAEIAADARRLESLVAGSFITETAKARIPDLLTNIARQSLKAGQDLRGRK